MRVKKSKPQIGKREALKLAKEALEAPLDALREIATKEQHTVAELSVWGHERPLWLCRLSFAGSMYAARGSSASAPSEAVNQAILRAYDVGSEKSWQLRQKQTHQGSVD